MGSASAWVVHVRVEAVDGLQELLAEGGVDLTRARADTAAVIRDLATMQLSLDLHLERTLGDTVTAPNVLGIIEGSDPHLKDEYVVISAHLDEPGRARGQQDSLGSTADDAAVGAAGLLTLAKAFQQLGARPARSITFLATSGGTKPGRWGSASFFRGLDDLNQSLPFGGTTRGTFWVGDYQKVSVRMDQNGIAVVGASVAHAILNLHLGAFDRPAGDSLVIDGAGDVEIETPIRWLAAAHPELALTVVDGRTVARPSYEHIAFIRHNIPSLHLQPSPGHQAYESFDTAAADRAARLLRFTFYLAQEVANAKRAPRWPLMGRQGFLGGVAHPSSLNLQPHGTRDVWLMVDARRDILAAEGGGRCEW